MLKISKKIIFMIFLFFISNSIVKADIEIISGGLSQGSNSDCSKVSGYVACYSPKFQFRVTLVDENGNKVNGTNSVDFTYGENDDPYKEKNEITIYKNVPFEGATVNLVNSNYRFKYGNNQNASFQYVEAMLIEDMSKYQSNGKNDHSKYNEFFNEFMSNIVSDSSKKRNRYINYGGGTTDFLSLFAYLSGYIKNETKNIKDIDIEDTTKAKEIAEKNYYLLIEPTFVIYYNTKPNSAKYTYIYGTGQEIVNWLKEQIKNNSTKYANGYLAGLSLNFVYQASCNLYTPQNNLVGFNRITEITNCSYSSEEGLGKKIDSKPYPARNLRTEVMNDVTKLEKGYGAYVLSLKNEFLIPTPDTIDSNLEYEVDLCNKKEGIISLENNSKNKDVLNTERIQNKTFLINGTFGTENAVYCYDEILYDFSSIIEQINKEKYGRLDIVTIPDGTVTIDRNCYFNGVGDKSIGSNFETYKNKNFKLKAFNQFIDLKLKSFTIDSTSSREKTINFFGEMDGKGWVNYIIRMDYGPEEGKETIQLSPSEHYDLEAYIDFSNYTNENLFGSDIYIDKSNNIITNAFKAPITINNLQIETTINSNDERKCKFNYTIDDTPLPFNGEGLQFRVISLSNPFPARDGTSRLPGTNWLDAKNYVYDYIDNNRAIQYKLGKIKENTEEKTQKEIAKADPNAMYTNTEPMYVIDLDASTMKKIREYNKDHTYTDIKLTCDSNNRQCTSDFLRNELEGVNIPIKLTGVCSNKEDYNEVLVKYNGITEERLRNVIYGGGFYQKSYDINKNLRNDTDDLEIFLNETKNTFFYTCADKSYLSGG